MQPIGNLEVTSMSSRGEVSSFRLVCPHPVDWVNYGYFEAVALMNKALAAIDLIVISMQPG